MYNPSRGGVRGGADQFTWESVKSDKHRENYLGHSLKAPVGRWQKGKDLAWYSKERKDDEKCNSNKSEMAAIKAAEEEAMLIALGHNIVKKETQPLSKEEIKEVLKRNIGDRDDHNIERIDGVGSGRRALLGGSSLKLSNEGVAFETSKRRKSESPIRESESPLPTKKSKSKKSKKHKHKKKYKHTSDYSDSDHSDKIRTHKRSKSKREKSPKKSKRQRKSEHRHQSRSNSSNSESDYRKQRR